MENLQVKIRAESANLWVPSIPENKPPAEPTNTWFNITATLNPNPEHNAHAHSTHYGRKVVSPMEVMRCRKVCMILDEMQQTIMKKWLFAYTHMYNATIELLKDGTKGSNWKNIRTTHLMVTKKRIQENSQVIGIEKKTNVPIHVLDGAIKLACANYKTAMTNLRAKRIKHFRIHKWLFNRRHMVLDVESVAFSHGNFYKKIFGQIQFKYNGEDFDIKCIKCDCKVYHDKLYDIFILLVPEEHTCEYHYPEYKTVALDPGLRTFMTGISKDNTIDICGESKAYDRIGAQFAVMDNIKIKSKSQKKIDRVSQRCRRKIVGLVEELHWKTAKYLTDHYEHILIGDLSAKGIVSCNNRHELPDISKRIAMALSFYKFRGRLQFKCQQKCRQYTLIDEHYTSKLCSLCGACKNDLGSAHVYNCEHCHAILGRDVNGARNIYLKHGLTEN